MRGLSGFQVPMGAVIVACSIVVLWLSSLSPDPRLAFLMMLIATICIAAETLGAVRIVDRHIARWLASQWAILPSLRGEAEAVSKVSSSVATRSPRR